MSTDVVPDGEECTLCKDNYTIASLGPCDHRICFKCSVRLRVICESNDCPVCRKPCDQVIITRFQGTFLSLVRSIGFQKKGFLYTENELMREVEDLLAFKCKFCSVGLAFGSFEELRKHCSKEHKLLFCDLCYENLKLFPYERKAYTSPGLVEHRRNGDKDDTSYRPHPSCQFCDHQRYFDDDSLFRHLKSDHFSCHLCQASIVFYRDYFELRRHFGIKHFLCEEGNCREARFTNAFGNELDLKSHRVAYHANLMSKEELRENAKLDLGVFSRLNLSPDITRREIPDRGDPERPSRGERISKYEKRLREIQKEREVLHSDGNDSDSNTTRRPETVQLTPAEFPALGNRGSAAKTKSSQNPVAEGHATSAADRIALFTRTHNVGKVPVKREEDFPALPSSTKSARPLSGKNGAWATSSSSSSKKGGGHAKTSSNKQRISSEVGNSKQHARPAAVQQSKKASKNSERPAESAALEQFPALSSYSNDHFDEDDYNNVLSNNDLLERKISPIAIERKTKPTDPAPVAAVSTSKAEAKKAEKSRRKNEEASLEQFPPLPTSAERNQQPVPAGSSKSPPPGFASVTANSQPALSGTNKVAVEKPRSREQQAVEKLNITSAEDFPGLPASSKPVSFPSKPGKPKSKPPGFCAPVRSIAPEQVVPPAPAFPYWRTDDYEKRNNALQGAIVKMLNACSLDEFRQHSRRFRDNVLPAFDFLSKCVDLFPRKQLSFIISELIVLLPDITKQRCLYDAVTADSHLSSLISHLLSTCTVCGQVVTTKDAPMHRQSHNPTFRSASGLPTRDEDSYTNIDLSNYIVSTAT